MLRVLLADGDSTARKALALLLNRKLGISDTCEAADGKALAAQLAACQPDLVLVDLALPGRPSLAACRWSLSTRLVVMGVNAEDAAAAQAAQAGFIHQAMAPEQTLAEPRAALAPPGQAPDKFS